MPFLNFTSAMLILSIIAVAATTATRNCLIINDDRAINHARNESGQKLLMEAFVENGVRVRAVPSQSMRFRDDLVSALVPQSTVASTSGVYFDESACLKVSLTQDGPSNVTNGNLMAKVLADGRLEFIRVSDNKILLSERHVRKLVPTVTRPPLPGFSSVDVSFKAFASERIYGLGQHRSGSLNNKNTGPLKFLPANTEILIPVAHSSLGSVFLFNLPSSGYVEYNDTLTHWRADTVIQLDMWVATTHDSPPHATSPWAQLQSVYADATGHAPVYPEWTSGFWQSKNRYHNQTQIMDVARGYQERSLPLQLMIIDYYNWAPNPLGDETLPAQCWPDPAAMVQELKDMGIELMISPYFHAIAGTSKYFADAERKHLLALDADSGKPVTAYDDAYIYDLFQPEARAFAFAAVKKGYIDPYDLHHWWLDCDEPCGLNFNDPNRTTADLLYNNGTWPASFVGSAYPHMLDQMVYEGMTASDSKYKHDNVMLARSAWAGSQKFGGAVWSGDTSSNFINLNQQFRAGLNLVMSGLPYWTTDIGGYAGGDIDSPSFRQLIVRWFQWGAFCPLFRLHGSRGGGPNEEGGTQCGGSGASNEVWNFGDASEAAIRRVMDLRESLRPYVMEQYELASSKGIPVMRPMFFDFWNDAQANSDETDDQMMFGPSYLVAPQMNENSTERVVYLPALPNGEVWRNVFTLVEHNTSAGGMAIVESTPFVGDGFDTFPLYYKAKLTPYPPSPPTPKPLPVCDKSCTITNSTDGVGRGHRETIPCVSAAACCDICINDPKCFSFVFGLDREIPTCYLLLSAVRAVITKHGRSYGCVRG